MNHKLVGTVLWVCVGAALAATFAMRNSGRDTTTESDQQAAEEDSTTTVTIPTPQMSLGEFALTNTQGKVVSKDDVIGHPTVFSFVFAGCAGPCREITRAVKELHEELADTDARFVTITVDPERDTVERFGSYADIFDPDYDRWQFLTGPKEDIYNMIRGGFQLQVKELFGEDAKPGFEIVHTNRVVLVNAEGVPVKSYIIRNEVDRTRLTRILKGEREFPQPPRSADAVTIDEG